MTPPDSDNADYKVGYGKPPKHTRFEKGRSGNAKGRPKGSVNVATLLEQLLNERIPVTQNGRTQKRSRLELMLISSTNKAVKGDTKALTSVFNLMQRTGIALGEANPTTATPLSDEDDATIQRALAAIQGGSNDDPEGN